MRHFLEARMIVVLAVIERPIFLSPIFLSKLFFDFLDRIRLSCFGGVSAGPRSAMQDRLPNRPHRDLLHCGLRRIDRDVCLRHQFDFHIDRLEMFVEEDLHQVEDRRFTKPAATVTGTRQLLEPNFHSLVL